MSALQALTIFHTAISILAILAGIPVVAALLANERHRWTGTFLLLAVATSITGYAFPFHGVTPAMITGVVALVILALIYVAQRQLGNGRIWQWTYAGGVVLSLYLLLFVAVVQAFQKIGPLNRFAPNGSEPPFAIAQVALLVISLAITVAAGVRYRPPLAANPRPPTRA